MQEISATSTSRAPGVGHTAPSSPFCYQCGYDLSGLAPPHHCPECGVLSDPTSQLDTVNRWCAGWRAWLWCFTRPSKTPTGLCYVAKESERIRVTCRRLMLLLWLPCVFTILIVIVGACCSIQFHVKIWYYENSDLERAPLRTVSWSHTTDLFNFNLNLFGGDVFFRQPTNWTRVDERTPKQIEISWPPRIDFITVICGASPLIFLLTGYTVARLVVCRIAKRAAEKTNHPELESSTKYASTLVAFPAAVALWLWLCLITVGGLSEAMGFDAWPLEWLGPILFFLAVGLWVYAGVVGWLLLIAADSARKIFPVRKLLGMCLAVVHVGAPLIVLRLIELFV